MVSMDKMMKECMKPHALMHSLSGFGVALIVVGLWPDLSANALTYGIILLVVGILGDMWAQSKG